MLKPPAATMPGMTDTLDFVKNLWGSMNIPGMSMPGMSAPPLTTDELDKRIADLKAVESWLNMNVTMLRGTIQALEVQRGTLATLKSMGDSMADAMRQSGVSAENMAAMPFASFFGAPPGDAAAAASSDASSGAAGAMPAALAWWTLLQDQFSQAVAGAMTPKSGDGATAQPPQPSTPSQPQAGTDSDATQAGNGKARGPKPKADKP